MHHPLTRETFLHETESFRDYISVGMFDSDSRGKGERDSAMRLDQRAILTILYALYHYSKAASCPHRLKQSKSGDTKEPHERHK